MKLSEFKVLTFDCYGTLIDWETGMINGLKPLTDCVSQPLTRDQILEAHAYYESTQQKHTPSKNYQEILSIVYRRLAESWNVPVRHEECMLYGKSVKHWPSFPDSLEALRYLKQHYKLVILSNVDHESFAASNEKLGVNFDAIYTAVDIGTYKPAAKNFDYMLSNLERLGYKKEDILHTAESMFHDHAPANKHGLANCWIYRRHDQEGFGATRNPGEMPRYDFQFTSMRAMAEAHAKEAQ